MLIITTKEERKRKEKMCQDADRNKLEVKLSDVHQALWQLDKQLEAMDREMQSQRNEAMEAFYAGMDEVEWQKLNTQYESALATSVAISKARTLLTDAHCEIIKKASDVREYC